MRQTLLAFAAVALLAPAAARAQPLVQSQEGIALENQILALQQQVQQLQSSSGNNGGSALGNNAAPAPSSNGAAPDSSIVTSLLTQVQQLQTQVQQLNGEVDTLQNQVNTQHDATEKEIGDLKFQMTGGTTPGAPAAPGAPVTPGATPTLGTLPLPAAPVPAAVPASPKLALHAGELAFEKGNYAAAEANARAVLAADKISPEGYQAQYLLAESLLAQGKAQDAAIAYDDEYNRSRTGTNAAGSLLGLANSLTDINQAAAACDTLASLESQFPTPPPGLQPRINAASKRAHCS
jgi:TolA-binding protein